MAGESCPNHPPTWLSPRPPGPAHPWCCPGCPPTGTSAGGARAAAPHAASLSLPRPVSGSHPGRGRLRLPQARSHQQERSATGGKRGPILGLPMQVWAEAWGLRRAGSRAVKRRLCTLKADFQGPGLLWTQNPARWGRRSHQQAVLWAASRSWRWARGTPSGSGQEWYRPRTAPNAPPGPELRSQAAKAKASPSLL